MLPGKRLGVNELRMPFGLTGGQKSMRTNTKYLDS